MAVAIDRPPRKTPSLKARAIALLAWREYSRAELRAKLAGAVDRGVDDVAKLDAVLDELAAQGYLSDARFATSVVRQKSGGYSKRAIGATLKARGVTGDAAAEALAGHEVDDHEAMVALWRRRFGKAPTNDRERARQVRFLQSRGFGLSEILKLLKASPDHTSGE